MSGIKRVELLWLSAIDETMDGSGGERFQLLLLESEGDHVNTLPSDPTHRSELQRKDFKTVNEGVFI